MQIDRVTDILRETAESEILPRFRILAASEVWEKSPGEIVTIADREAERIISHRLREILDAPVVGEEAVAADSGLIDALRWSPKAWLVDPLDGTSNFVDGRTDFAVMAALVHEGETVASWIVQPVSGTAYVAERGAGAWRNGLPLHRAPASANPAQLKGIALTGFLSPEAKTYVAGLANRFAALTGGTGCAGIEYPKLAEGGNDFILYERTLPWDHAPGAFLLSEAGGVALRLDGRPYRPGEQRCGLLNSADRESWTQVREILTPGNMTLPCISAALCFPE